MEKRGLCTLNGQLGFDVQLEDEWDMPLKREIRKTRRLERLGRLSGLYVRSGRKLKAVMPEEFKYAHSNNGKDKA